MAIDQREALIAAVRAQVEKEKKEKEEKARKEAEAAKLAGKKTSAGPEKKKQQFKTLTPEQLREIEEKKRRKLAEQLGEAGEGETEELKTDIPPAEEKHEGHFKLKLKGEDENNAQAAKPEENPASEEAKKKENVKSVNEQVKANAEAAKLKLGKLKIAGAPDNNVKVIDEADEVKDDETSITKEGNTTVISEKIQWKSDDKTEAKTVTDDVFNIVPNRKGPSNDVKKEYDIDEDDDSLGAELSKLAGFGEDNMSAEAKKAAEEHKRKVEETLKEKEAKREAERKKLAEAEKKANEQERRIAEAAARKKAAEAAARRAEEDAARKAEEEARKKAAEEERRKAAEAARKKAEEEARAKAKEEAKKKVDEVKGKITAAEKALEDIIKANDEEAKKAADNLDKQAKEAGVKAKEIAAKKAKENIDKAADEAAKKAAAEAEKKFDETEKARLADVRKKKDEAAKAANEAVEKAKKDADAAAKVTADKIKAIATAEAAVKAAQRAVDEAKKNADSAKKAEADARKKIDDVKKSNEAAAKKAEEEEKKLAEEAGKNKKKAAFDAAQKASEEARAKAEKNVEVEAAAAAKKAEEDVRAKSAEAVKKAKEAADKRVADARKAVDAAKKELEAAEKALAEADKIKIDLTKPADEGKLPMAASYLEKYTRVERVAKPLIDCFNGVAANPEKSRNVAILGEHGFGLVVAGEDFARSFYDMGICTSKVVGKIAAKALNKMPSEKLSDAFGKLAGACMVIENVGSVLPDRFKEIVDLAKKKKVAVIITGEKDSVIRLLDGSKTKDSFTHSVEINNLTPIEMAIIAGAYIAQLGCSMDESVDDVISKLLMTIESGNVDRMLKAIDDAVMKCDQREKGSGTRKLIASDFQ